MDLWIIECFDKTSGCCTSQACKEIERSMMKVFTRDEAEKFIVDQINEWHEDRDEKLVLKVAKQAMDEGTMKQQDGSCQCGELYIITEVKSGRNLSRIRDFWKIKGFDTFAALKEASLSEDEETDSSDDDK